MNTRSVCGSRSGQRGVALIIVLLIVALVSILATEMGTRLQIQVKRAANIKDNNQAYWYAMGAEQFARKSVAQLTELDDGVIHLDQPWTQELIYPLPGGGIQAQLFDMQNCFNLNALSTASAGNGSTTAGLLGGAFSDMLRKSEAEIPSFNIDTLRDSLIDWIDKDDSLSPYGAEDSDYESLAHPYLAANNLMLHKSELRLINGIEMEWLADVLSLVCVIPDNDVLSVNINTLTQDQAPLLAGLTGLSLQDARDRISSRPPDGYKDVNDFLSLAEIQALNLPDEKKAWFTVKSKYFVLQTRTRFNDASFMMGSVLHLNSNNEVSVLFREFAKPL